MAGGSSHTFVAESPDECARAVMGVTPQSSLLPLLSPLLLPLHDPDPGRVQVHGGPLSRLERGAQA